LILDARAAQALGELGDVTLALETFLSMSGDGVMARAFHDDGSELWEPLMTTASTISSPAALDVAAELAVTRPSHLGEAQLAPPTEQELKMFAALRRTGSRAGAARALKMSENTLKYYLKRVFAKWRVRDWRLAMHIADRIGG
jgi:hypothetical protein